MTQTVLEGLLKIKENITPENWVQGHFYQRTTGKMCLIGQHDYVWGWNPNNTSGGDDDLFWDKDLYYSSERIACYEALNSCSTSLFSGASPITVNDHHGYDAVQQVLDCAIKKAREAEDAT